MANNQEINGSGSVMGTFTAASAGDEDTAKTSSTSAQNSGTQKHTSKKKGGKNASLQSQITYNEQGQPVFPAEMSETDRVVFQVIIFFLFLLITNLISI